jgi:multidrug efflux system outer membrane protein
VTEQAIAIFADMAPAGFTLDPVDDILVAKFTIPRTIPATLLESRPDIAGTERKMA